MSLRRDDVGIITLHESFRREPPPDATPEAIAAQMEAYLAKGGQIHQMPMGASAQSLRDPLRPDRLRASAGGKRGGAAKKGLPNRGKKSEIRTEDYS